MEASDDDNPKLFKLTAAVTAIQPIIKAIQEVFAQLPEQESRRHAGQQFSPLTFCARRQRPSRWEEGVVIGMSGEGVLPISNLTLAKVSGTGIAVSGNGGADDLQGRRELPRAGRADRSVLHRRDEIWPRVSWTNFIPASAILMEERGFRR